MKPVSFEAIFRTISLPCLVLKPENDHFLIVDANEAYLKIIGAASEDIVGMTSCEAFPKNLKLNGPNSLLKSLSSAGRTPQDGFPAILRRGGYGFYSRGIPQGFERGTHKI